MTQLSCQCCCIAYCYTVCVFLVQFLTAHSKQLPCTHAEIQFASLTEVTWTTGGTLLLCNSVILRLTYELCTSAGTLVRRRVSSASLQQCCQQLQFPFTGLLNLQARIEAVLPLHGLWWCCMDRCDLVASTVTSRQAGCSMTEGQALLCKVILSGLLHCVLLYHVHVCSFIVDNLLVAANLTSRFGLRHRMAPPCVSKETDSIVFLEASVPAHFPVSKRLTSARQSTSCLVFRTAAARPIRDASASYSVDSKRCRSTTQGPLQYRSARKF